MLPQIILILIGGGVGAVTRFLFSEGIYNILGRSFPYGILITNIAGSLVMGFLAAVFIYKYQHDGMVNLLKPLILTGFLGGFTTFSSFSLDTLNLINNGEPIKAASYVILSVILAISFAFCGFLIGKNI
jgi:fluoride exporter